MKAKYRIDFKPIDKEGNKAQWRDKDIKAMAELVLEFEDGTIRKFKGIVEEVTEH